MVNLATVNYLPELQQYEAQIPRLEDGWWPTGGAVNPAADSGLMNWQASLLANRTAFLKKVIDDSGLGAAAVPLVTLNAAAARITGSYRFASTDANTPASGVAGTVQVIAASAAAVNQIARDSNSTQMWTRFWNGTVWSAWAEILIGPDLTGMIGYFARTTAPPGFLKANGAAYSRTIYARLFSAIGTTFGAGDGSTTFNVPDLRAEFIRGWDDGRGVDSGRALGSYQAQNTEDHKHESPISVSSPVIRTTGPDPFGLGTSTTFVDVLNTSGVTVPDSYSLTNTMWPASRTGETRPRNVAMLACIKF